MQSTLSLHVKEAYAEIEFIVPKGASPLVSTQPTTMTSSSTMPHLTGSRANSCKPDRTALLGPISASI
jgi:hypothetical protein